MRKWKLILTIVVLAIGLPIAAVASYEWWTCRPKEKAHQARRAELQQKADAIRIGMDEQEVREYFTALGLPSRFSKENGRPIAHVDVRAERCESLVCDNYVTIQLTVYFDARGRVVGKDVRTWRTCL